MPVYTVGHGTRPAEELVATLVEAGVETLVDVRRFPQSRRNPQFGQAALAASVEDAGLQYVHLVELGGRRSGEPGEDRFPCLRVAAFRSYAVRMGQPEWQAELRRALAEPSPCFLCAETHWTQCHRRLIAELLTARGEQVVHLLGPGRREPHRPYDVTEIRDGRLYLCGRLVA
jgi:uncharacterized protein (DUF488 family)